LRKTRDVAIKQRVRKHGPQNTKNNLFGEHASLTTLVVVIYNELYEEAVEFRKKSKIEILIRRNIPLDRLRM
jgi:hypothetical protein